MSAGLEARIQQLINRMGKSGDAAGILTLFAHLAEIEARLTSGRAAKLDNVLSDAVWTAAKAAYLDAAISGRASGAQADLIIAYVDELESRLTAVRAAKLDEIGVWNDAPGTLTVQSKIGNTSDNSSVVTLFGLLKKLDAKTVTVQRGFSQFNSGTIDITITAVDLNKSFVTIGGNRYDAGNNYMPVARLTSATNLRIEAVNGFLSTIAWEVVQIA